jgi:hypothetical protein
MQLDGFRSTKLVFNKVDVLRETDTWKLISGGKTVEFDSEEHMKDFLTQTLTLGAETMSETKENRKKLIEEAVQKVNRINSGNAFVSDFEAARIIKRLIIEVRLLEIELEKEKKLSKLRNKLNQRKK